MDNKKVPSTRKKKKKSLEQVAVLPASLWPSSLFHEPKDQEVRQ